MVVIFNVAGCFCRLIEELKEVRWLPQDESQAYTLQEFHSALVRRNKESRALLEKFLQFRSFILNMVLHFSFPFK